VTHLCDRGRHKDVRPWVGGEEMLDEAHACELKHSEAACEAYRNAASLHRGSTEIRPKTLTGLPGTAGQHRDEEDKHNCRVLARPSNA